jgi:thiol-disulfide isomerase/thioredoxin
MNVVDLKPSHDLYTGPLYKLLVNMKRNKIHLLIWAFLLPGSTFLVQAATNQDPKQVVATGGISFELELKVSLFDFPCKVVILQNSGSGSWEPAFSQVVPPGGGIVKGKLEQPDYILLRMYPVSEPNTLVGTHKLFIQDGRTVVRWDTTLNKFVVEGSALDAAFQQFQKVYMGLKTQKGQAEEANQFMCTTILQAQYCSWEKLVFADHIQDVLGPYLLTTCLSHDLDVATYRNSLARLSDEMKASGWGRRATLRLGAMDALALGKVAPAFSVQTIESKQISLSQFKGKYVFIDFWASWCGPCMKELPYIEKLRASIDESQLVILSVSNDQSKEQFNAALAKYPKNWIHILDMDNKKELSKAFGVDRLPSSFLLNGKGEIVAKDLRGNDLVNAVTELLKKQEKN